MRILIVDDNFMNRNYLLKLIQPLGECNVAVNGVEAVDGFCNSLETGELYDLICMDIMMPEMDGHQALAKIREIENENGIDEKDQVAVIMTSANSDHDSILKSFRNKCEAYLMKPIMRDQLFAELEKLGLMPAS